MLRSETVDRFWSGVDVRGPDECWHWTARRDRKSYGRFHAHEIRKSSFPAQRIAWLIEHGELPPSNIFICHRCDNPPCVNPAHLFAGTAGDNNRDSLQKGRRTMPTSVGSKNSQAKITEADVAEVLRLRAAGHTLRSIGDRFGVTPTMVCYIVKGKNWQHVPRGVGHAA